MNRIHTTVAIAGLCAVIVGWQVWRNSASPTSAPNTEPVISELKNMLPATPTKNSESTPRVNTQEHADLPGQETEIVMGFRVRKDRNCDVQIHYITDAETGEVHEAMSCEPRNPEAPDPYKSWSNELLAQEAYADAKAAEVLALRHINSGNDASEQIGLNLLYRSVALSGNPEVFRKAIGARYATVYENGKSNIGNLKQLLVFSQIGLALGAKIYDPDTITRDLRDLDVSEEEISELRKTSHLILEQMASLQTEITGATSIREALANA